MNQHLIIYEELDEYPISDNSSDLYYTFRIV